MAHVEAINKAISAHGMWKQRLTQAIETGQSEFTVDKVRPDNNCEFGKWLYSLPPAEQGASWKAVRELHARFHPEAAKVLDLALKGKKEEAKALISLSSEFATLSSQLTLAMMKWAKEGQAGA